MSIVSSIGRTTVLEAVRNRLIWLAGIIIAAALGLGQFLNQVAVIESAQIQAALLAAFLRIAAAFIIVTFAVSSMVRESNDKVTELLLSLPVPRSTYLLGKFAGFALVAFIVAALLSLPLLAHLDLERVWPWSISLAAELLILAAISMFCALSLSQTLSAFAAVGGFYLLARSIATMQIIAGAGLVTEPSLPDRIVGGMVDAIALLLPGFDRMTQTGWLTDTPVSGVELLGLIAQSLVYLVLIVGASLFDLHRKNL